MEISGNILVICMEARSTIERGNSTICDLNPKMLMQVWHLIIVVHAVKQTLTCPMCGSYVP